MTPGRRALLIVAERLARAEVAMRCGVSVSVVHDVCSGRRNPSKALRATLVREFGIPSDSWTLPRCTRGQH